ncbi:MAG: ATP-binding cassette domain-containing protein [Planctomycetes bacterium]|nr:ATP-binding cassette domain-containing protein [Planctomycetota bacterium]
MIEVDKLTKYYGNRPAVSEMSFFVGEGETVGFLGPNGAGKSTTMRMLTGFLSPTSGTAKIAGFDIQENPIEARKNLGYLPESTPLYKDMRVCEFLAYRGRIKGVPASERSKAIDECLEKCRVTDVRNRIIGHLSKGYRQRVGLADTLLGKPKLLILDEPTVGLDPNQVVETRSLIQEIGENRTVFLSTHILHEVELVCQRVFIINQGTMIAEGNTADLCGKYAEHRELVLHLFTDDDPAADLENIKGVKKVEARGKTAEGARELFVTCSKGSDPRSEIARTISEKGWILQEMRMEPVRLEDIFAKLTVNSEQLPA